MNYNELAKHKGVLMKASKQFATVHAQSHLPSQMIHTEVHVIGIDTPANDNHIVIVELKQRRTTCDYICKLRMNSTEARNLAALLSKMADNCGIDNL